MNLTQKINYLQENNYAEWVKTYKQVEDEMSAKQEMFCVCGKLATGLHESGCRKFRGKITSETASRLKHLIKNTELKTERSSGQLAPLVSKRVLKSVMSYIALISPSGATKVELIEGTGLTRRPIDYAISYLDKADLITCEKVVEKTGRGQRSKLWQVTKQGVEWMNRESAC